MRFSFSTQHGLIITCLFFVAQYVYGDESLSSRPVVKPSRTELSYDVDASLFYLDKISSFSRPAVAGSDESTKLADDKESESSTGFKSIGLKHAKLGFEWSTPRRMLARLVLRPDASTQNGVKRRELDTRSGPKFSDMPDIELLDLYEFAVLREGISFAIAVRDEVMPSFKAFEDVVGFGMEVSFVRKAFGMYLDLPEALKVDEDGKVSVSLHAVNEQGDRHTQRVKNDELQDESPASKSPYWGGGINAALDYGYTLGIGAGAALVETKLQAGKNTTYFYSLGARRGIGVAGSTMRLAMDLRQKKTVYKMEELSLPTTSLTSAAITSAIEVALGREILSAIRVGSGSRISTNDTTEALNQRGVQAEIGLRGLLSEGLDAAGLLTREWCTGKMEIDGQAGCFGTQGSRRSAISRMAIEFRYRTGGSL